MQPIGGWSLAPPNARVHAQLVSCPEHEIAAAICVVRRGLVHVLWRSENAALQGGNGVSVMRTPSNVVSLHGFWRDDVLHVLVGGEDAKLYSAAIPLQQLPLRQVPCQEVVLTRATQLSTVEQRHVQAQQQPILQLAMHQRTCFAVDGFSVRVLEMNHDFTAGLLKERLSFAEMRDGCVHMTMIFRDQAHGGRSEAQSMSTGLFEALFQAHCTQPISGVGLIALESGRSFWLGLSPSGGVLPALLPFHRHSGRLLDWKVQGWRTALLEGLSRDTLSLASADGQLLFLSATMQQQHQRPQQQQQRRLPSVLSNRISLTSGESVESARFYEAGVVYCSDNALWIQSLERPCSGDVQLGVLRKLPSVVPRYLSSTSAAGQLLLVNPSGKINCYQTGVAGKEQEGAEQSLAGQLNDAAKQLKAVSQERATVGRAVAMLTDELANLSALSSLLRVSSNPAAARAQLRSSFQVSVKLQPFPSPTLLVSHTPPAECLLVLEIRCLRPAVLKAVLSCELAVSCRQDAPAVTGSHRVDTFCVPLRDLWPTEHAIKTGVATMQVPWVYANSLACTVDVSLRLSLCQSAAAPLPHGSGGAEPSPVAGVAVHLARATLMHADLCSISADESAQQSAALSWRPLAWEPSTRPFTVRLTIPFPRADDGSSRGVGWSDICAMLASAFGQRVQASDNARALVIHSPVYGTCSLRPHVQPEQAADRVVQVLAQTTSAVLLVCVRAAVCRVVQEMLEQQGVDFGKDRCEGMKAPPGARYSLSPPMQQAYLWCEATMRALEADTQPVTTETLLGLWKQYRILRRLHA